MYTNGSQCLTSHPNRLTTKYNSMTATEEEACYAAEPQTIL